MTTPDLPAIFERSNSSVQQELQGHLSLVEGALPDDLRGVLFRNGPGRLEHHGHRYGHLFDGDGHINRFAFTDQGVSYRNRYVRTREYLAEEAARTILFRNFGTNIPGGLHKNFLRTRFKNVANTSLVFHAGRLLALWEAGLPHRIDPTTLDTLARDDLGGTLRNPGNLVERLIAPELPFSAHPRICPDTGDLYNFGLTSSGTRTRLCLYRLSRDGVAAAPEFLDLPGGCFFHDFLLTARYRVFFLSPTTFDVKRMLLGLAPPAELLQGVPGPTQILVVDRQGTRSRRFEARPCFIFHFPGGYEDTDGALVLDGCRMDSFPRLDPRFDALAEYKDTYPRPYLTRYRLDLEHGGVDEVRLSEHPGELATTNPNAARRHRYTWMVAYPPGAGQPFATGIARVDCDARTTLYRDFSPDLTGEPVFVPRPGASAEDDGWLLSLHYRDAARTCDLLVLNARDLTTLCRLRLPHSTPLGFHGIFVPAARLLA